MFSSVTNRTTGLNVLATGAFRSAYLVFDMVMFIISSNPNAIAMKSSRRGSKSAQQYTKELLINVVAGISLCWVLILLFELSNPFVQTPFPTLFECASAFGTVGLSMGFGTSNASLSGAYSVPSKVVIMILMAVGCHRSLPENEDMSVQMEMPSGHVKAVVAGGLNKPFITKATVIHQFKLFNNNK